MPHFVIEYSRDVETRHDMNKIMQLAHDAGAESGVMDPVDIKVRAYPCDHYRLLNEKDNFVHVTVYLLVGRSDAQKEKVALALREKLQGLLVDITSISVDIRDMNAVAYKKRLLPG